MVSLAFAAGVVVGVVHHAWLHPRLKKLWQMVKRNLVRPKV
jgi:hypothetical protein